VEHKFQINLRGLIDLLSNHLYSGPEVFVRELLQNGVDAIRARLQIEPGHSGEIALEVHAVRGVGGGSGGRKPATLSFSDNGIGLTEEEVHRFLATIGESSKRAAQGDRPTDFIGQFGIGLLSCFVVSDEIVVVTRSARGGSLPLEWRGRPDGTYTLKTLDADLAAGTVVYLTCREGSEEYFDPARVRELARHFGGLLPYPIRVTSGAVSEVINEAGAPWRQEHADEASRTRALLAFGQEAFGTRFLDAIPLRAKAGDLDGVAFVLPYSPGAGARKAHRVYLKNMLLSESADNLLPEWAFFVKAVVNANDLRPTASRESFYEDAKLEAARTSLGEQLRSWLVEQARRRPEKLERLIELHHLAIRALALEDDEFYRLFIHWLPFETSQGAMTLGAYREANPVIRYVPDRDQFRQIARVAAAQKLCIINAGYTYEAELLARYAELFPEASVEVVDPAGLAQSFEDLQLQEQEAVHEFLRLADAVLRPFRCSAEVKKFQPGELPALYSTSSEGRFLRSVEQSKEIADPLWSGVLDSLSRRERASTPAAQLVFNYKNPLVRRLAGLANQSAVRRSVEMLYVQALLLGHHPLNSREMRLLNEGLLALIEMGVGAEGGAP
jgi:molecular chaperone HtpG